MMQDEEPLEHTEHQLKLLAARLKDAFRRKKAVKENRPYKPHPRFDTIAIWLKTARVVASLKANPEEYIEAQFRFARATVFANTLHGKSAVARYKQFRAICNNLPAGRDDESLMNPGKAEVLDRIAAVLSLLKTSIGHVNLLAPDAIAELQRTPHRYDALGVMLQAGTVPEYKELFEREAVRIYLDNPYIREACASLQLDTTPIRDAIGRY